MEKIKKAHLTLNKLFKHRTFKNTSYLTIGNILSQIIALIGAFYIPRLLGPEKYGIFSIVAAYIGMFTVFTFSGINKVLLRDISKNLDDTKDIIESVIGFKNLCAILSIIISIVVLIFIDYSRITEIYIIIFSLTLLFNGLNSTINIIYQSSERMKPMAVFTILKPIIRVPIAILLLKTGYGVLSLIVLQVSVSALILIINYLYLKRFVKFNILSKVKITKTYLRQGFNFSLLSFLNILSTKIDLVMLSFLTTPVNVGIYALAYRIVQKGLFIRSPISASLFPYYTKRYENEKVKIRKLFKHTLIIIIPSLVIITGVIFSSKFIITTIVGDEFLESAKILNILILYLFVNYAVIPWGLYLQTTSNEKYSLLTVSVCAIANIVLNIMLFRLYGVIGIALSTLIVESLRFIITFYFVKRLL